MNEDSRETVPSYALMKTANVVNSESEINLGQETIIKLEEVNPGLEDRVSSETKSRDSQIH